MLKLNEILIDGKWGASYAPPTKTLYGGYSEDGKSFYPTFIITDMNDYDMPFILNACVLLYSDKGNINASYADVLDDYYNVREKWYYESVLHKDGVSKTMVE